MIKFCKTCLTPTSRPRTIFNNKGVCNACTNAKEKKKIMQHERSIDRQKENRTEKETDKEQIKNYYLREC